MIKTHTKKQHLVTTNVRIPEEELLTYREYALNEGKSFSQLVREILARAILLPETHAHTIRTSKRRSFWDINKYAIKGGDIHASQKIDDVVYGL